jgi:hypothetical protein
MKTVPGIVAHREVLLTLSLNMLDFCQFVGSMWTEDSRDNFYLTKTHKTGLYNVALHGAALFVCTVVPAIIWHWEWPDARSNPTRGNDAYLHDSAGHCTRHISACPFKVSRHTNKWNALIISTGYYHYGSTALHWALVAFFSFLLYTQSVGFLGRGSARRTFTENNTNTK